MSVGLDHEVEGLDDETRMDINQIALSIQGADKGMLTLTKIKNIPHFKIIGKTLGGRLHKAIHYGRRLFIFRLLSDSAYPSYELVQDGAWEEGYKIPQLMRKNKENRKYPAVEVPINPPKGWEDHWTMGEMMNEHGITEGQLLRRVVLGLFPAPSAKIGCQFLWKQSAVSKQPEEKKEVVMPSNVQVQTKTTAAKKVWILGELQELYDISVRSGLTADRKDQLRILEGMIKVA